MARKGSATLILVVIVIILIIGGLFWYFSQKSLPTPNSSTATTSNPSNSSGTLSQDCGAITGADYASSVDALTSQERTSMDCFYKSLVSCNKTSLDITGSGNGNANGIYAINGIQNADCLIAKTVTTSTRSCNVPQSYITITDQKYNQDSLNSEGTKKATVMQILVSVSIEKQFPWGNATSFTPLQCQ